MGPTVYDRYKKTGYLTGPRHRYESAMNEASSPPPQETEEESEVPPNLRDAGNSPGSCADCMNSEPNEQGLMCMIHGGYPVHSNQVCDDYEERIEEPAAEEGGEILSRGGGPPGAAIWARGAGAPEGDNSNPLDVVGARSRARAVRR